MKKIILNLVKGKELKEFDIVPGAQEADTAKDEVTAYEDDID